jgi:putative inorganic carbon (HCO3(-)) transporter
MSRGSHHVGAFLQAPLVLPLMLFGVSTLIGLWVAYDASLGRPLLFSLLGSLLLFAIIGYAPLRARKLRWIAWLLLMAQLLMATYFISQYSHLEYAEKMQWVTALGTLTGQFFPALVGFHPHPNAVATFLEGGVLLAVGLGLAARNRWERLAAGATSFVLGYALFLTASRGAWMAVAACVGLAVFSLGRHRLPHHRRALSLSSVILLVGTLALMLALSGTDHMRGPSAVLFRAQDRLKLYQNGLYLIRDYPLTGIGLGTFGLIYSRYILLVPYLFLSYSHNLFLSIWLNQGLLGLVSFIWMMLAFFLLVLHRARRGSSSPLLWGAVLGLTAMLLHGLTDAPQYAESPWIMPVFFAYFGLSVAMLKPAEENNPPVLFSIPRRLKVVGAALFVVMIPVAAILLVNNLYINLGALQQTRADLAPSLSDEQRNQALNQAIQDYQQALTLNPGQPTIHWRMGLMALNNDSFPEAIEHLQIAYAALPGHRGIQKALGYAFLWDGQIQQAETLLKPWVEVPGELGYWSWWRGTQGQDQLSEYAQELRTRLTEN